MTHFNIPHGDVEEDFNKLPLLRFLVMHGVLFLAEETGFFARVFDMQFTG